MKPKHPADALAQIQREIADARASGRPIAFGAPVDVSPQRSFMQYKQLSDVPAPATAAPDPAIRAVVPEDPPAAIAAICRALGLDQGADGPTILAAVDALLGVTHPAPVDPAAQAAQARALGLSASELAEVRRAGCTVLAYAETKRARKAGK